MSKRIKIWVELYAFVTVFVIALAATLGSLYYSEVVGFIPCKLCWYQRILMYPITILAAVGIWRQDEGLPLYLLPLSLFGGSISIFHYMVQKGVFSQPGSCTVGIPCSISYVNYLGFITIPFLAGSAFLLISFFMAGFWWSRAGVGQLDIDDQ